MEMENRDVLLYTRQKKVIIYSSNVVLVFGDVQNRNYRRPLTEVVCHLVSMPLYTLPGKWRMFLIPTLLSIGRSVL